MIYLLCILLSLLLVVCFIYNKKDVTAPAVIFTTGFTFQSLWACIYKKTWNLDLHINTFLVILLGILEFVCISFMIKRILNKLRLKSKEESEISINKIQRINIKKYKEVIFILFIISVSILYVYYIVKAVGGSFNNISEIINSITKYDNIMKFSEQYQTVRIPSLISNLQLLIIACGYWFLYIIINNYLCDKKINVFEIVIVLLCVICSILDGSRGNALMILLAGFAYYFVLLNKKNNFTGVISKKMIRNIFIVGLLFIVVFVLYAKIMGRNMQSNSIFDYLSVYLGAEVKNLDLFLQEKNNIEKNTIWGSQTFIAIIATWGKKIGFNGYHEYKLDLPFRSVNGVGLGNVYTTFYPYIYDFGYIGCIVLVAIMAILSQVCYEIIKKIRGKKNVQICVLIYGVIYSCLLLSFFSNKFFENIFSMNFIKYIVIWFLLNLVFCEFDYKDNRIIKYFKNLIKGKRKVDEEICN